MKRNRCQVILPLDLGIKIDENDPVRKMVEICEELDYTKLYNEYYRIYRKVSPETMFELLVCGYMNGIYSSRDIEKACENDIRFMWILQNETAPDHSTIARFQNEKLVNAIEDLFYQLADKLLSMGEISYKNVFVDGTKIEANANRYSFVWSKSVEKQLDKLNIRISVEVSVIALKYGISSTATLEECLSREIFNKAQEELARRNNRMPVSAKTTVTAQGKYTKYALSDIMQCAECGSKYRRVTWSKNGTKKVVWRCVSRLDYGRNYCKSSPTITDEEIKLAIVRAIRKFNEDDHDYFITLMKATIGEAIGLYGSSDEIDLLNRRIDSLNRKMITMVNESIESGQGIDDRDEDFQAIASEIEQLKSRIKAIEEAVISDKSAKNKLEMLQDILDNQKGHLDQYDDSIVRQIIECVKVHHDKVEVIFGGGIMIEEGVNT